MNRNLTSYENKKVRVGLSRRRWYHVHENPSMNQKIVVMCISFFVAADVLAPNILGQDSNRTSYEQNHKSFDLHEPIEILFIGSSYFNFNDLPGLFEGLCRSAGRDVYVDHIGHNGMYPDDLVSSALTDAKITERDWEYIILQGTGSAMAYPWYFTDHPEYPALKTLWEKIQNSCNSTQMVYCMPWAFEDGMTWYQNWTDTYAEMQQKIYETTLKYAQDIGFLIAPVGWVWYAILEEQHYPLHYLHMGDWNHPSIKGSYLTSCVIYSTLFMESCVGRSNITRITVEEAAYFQSVASQLVLQNLFLWNIIDRHPIIVDDDNTIGPWDGSQEYPFQFIQEAVATASHGDLIYVYSGTYQETINIDQRIRLIGLDAQTTWIQGINNERVLRIVSDAVFVSGFSICNGSSGVEILSDFCELSNNHISNNTNSGVTLVQCNFTKIYSNYISDNFRGVVAYESGCNWIYENVFEGNNRVLSLWYSSDNNTISQNSFFRNHNDCVSLYYSSQNLVAQNTFTYNNYSIFLFQSVHNTITQNRITLNNDVGVLLEHSSENCLCENMISGNRNGIYLFCSPLNLVLNNSISENTDAGVYCSTLLDNSSGDDFLTMQQSYFSTDAPRSANEHTVIQGNILSNNTRGIVVENTTNMTIHANMITQHPHYGIELVNALDCLLEQNTITANRIGIKVVNSADCLITFQELSDNGLHAFFINSPQITWDSNYWDNWWVSFPKPIFGMTQNGIVLPAVQFDRNPLHAPLRF